MPHLLALGMSLLPCIFVRRDGIVDGWRDGPVRFFIRDGDLGSGKTLNSGYGVPCLAFDDVDLLGLACLVLPC